ncbi:MAG: hypothetical protein HUU46_04515 [Candidatus Hydrogenedentes bacterium]|nr:hypothetical protein [Candidatus Hydrogenedentota bacterium]
MLDGKLRPAHPFLLLFLLLPGIVPASSVADEAKGIAIPNPVMFVTQTPYAGDFAMVNSTFANHKGNSGSSPRGGHLYIRYPDGTLRNLTAELGYGVNKKKLLTVRDPHVHWDGTKALFSMVIGGITQDDYSPVYFQIYEVTGIGQGETASIKKLKQPKNYNNVAPCYATDDRIVFTSDRPRNGDRDLYPQLDEYESTATVSGLWIMNADGSNLHILDHAPSGDFDPFVDSFGRIVFTRWDHLQRDQQADADIYAIINGGDTSYDVVTYESEETNQKHDLAPGDEVFPEARGTHGPGGAYNPTWDDLQDTENGHTFNHFMPWAINEDGSDHETLNHIGRLEMVGYIPAARDYLPEAYAFSTPRITNFFQLAEDPTKPGRYYGTNAPEFSTHAAGQIVRLDAPRGKNADDLAVKYITHKNTAGYIGDGQQPDDTRPGLFRDPMPMTDGTLWAAHSSSPYADEETVNDPGYPNPYTYSSRYDFAIRQLVKGGPNKSFIPGARLIPGGIAGKVKYFENNGYREVKYDGLMWELQPVEVVARTRPESNVTPLPDIEADILDAELGGEAGVQELRDYLVANNLALVIARDVTMRADEQQDFNLKVAGSGHQHAETGSTPKEIKWLQFFSGKQVRGYRWDGRRVLGRAMGDDLNPPNANAPEGAVKIADDGSAAAFVPAQRAMAWQTTEPDGTAAVRERLWVTFKSGEIRVCTNCHGVNTTDLFGNPPPTNSPQALVDLLDWWKSLKSGGE